MSEEELKRVFISLAALQGVFLISLIIVIINIGG